MRAAKLAYSLCYSAALSRLAWSKDPAVTGCTWVSANCGAVPAPWQHRRMQHAMAWEQTDDSTAPSTSGRTTLDAASKGLPAAGPLVKYLEGREQGLYRPDPRQELTVHMLQELYENLAAAIARQNQHQGRRRRPSGLTIVDAVPSALHTSPAQPSRKGRGWFWGLSKLMHSLDATDTADGFGSTDLGLEYAGRHTAGSHGSLVRGLYMYGGVGVGKTMLMDIFVHSSPPEFQVVRIHFHDFMLDVHAKLRHFKGAEDPLVQVADQIAEHAKVLALDEFFVTDVADAMILSRLFGRLWERSLVLVATSNRAPDKLYENGLQRDLFVPFIHKLKAECVVHDMASGTDYRRLAQHRRGLNFVNPNREEELYQQFVELAHDAPIEPTTIEVMMGRKMEVAQSAGKVCLFTFEELCGRPVAAADYLALTQHYHTLALQGVPVFTGATRSEAYRFVTLIDVLYEHRIKFLCCADALPFELFENIVTVAEAAQRPEVKENPMTIVDDNLGFSKDRTISRLTEMQSTEYLLAHAKQHAPENILALEEAQRASKKSSAQH